LAVKTKPRAPASETGAASLKEYVEHVSQNRTKLLRAADEICDALGRQVTREQLNAKRFPIGREERDLFAALGWDIHAICKNVGRMQGVAELQRTAGTSAERAQAAEHLAAAKSELAAKGPQLEAQIIELQQELHRLQTSATAAQVDVDRREQALLALRDKVPGDVWEECIQQKRIATAHFRAKQDELKLLAKDLRQQEFAARRGQLEAELTARHKEIEREHLEVYHR
jgi:predicted nuclease with TOPRIM domain